MLDSVHNVIHKTFAVFGCLRSRVLLMAHVIFLLFTGEQWIVSVGLYRYVTRTNVSFFDPSPDDQRTEHSCA